MKDTWTNGRRRRPCFRLCNVLWLLFLTLNSGGHAQNNDTRQSWRHPAQIAWEGKTISETTAAANSGEATAQYYLAWINWFGERGQTNHAQAIHWFRSAATNGVPEAQFKLGVLLENGIGCAKDATGALSLYRQASSGSNAVVQFKLAYFNGEEPVNRAKSDGQLAMASSQGYLRASYHLAKRKYLNGKREEWQAFFPICAEAAGCGISEAQFDLVSIFLDGKGAKPDRALACQWLWTAALAGHAEAKAYLHSQHRLFPPEENGAAKRLAGGFIPKQPNPLYAHWERLLYQRPDFEVSKNKDIALQAAAGKADAQFELGLALCHESGTPRAVGVQTVSVVNGVRQKPVPPPATPRDLEASKWLRLAADQNNIEAVFQCGIRTLSAATGDAERNEGLRLLKRAAMAGHHEASHQLASFHQDLNGAGARLAEAVRWHRQAASANHAFSRQWLDGFLRTNFMTGYSGPVPAERQGKLSSVSKLAIIPTDPALAEVADLLSVAFSESAHAVLLERQEIARILREQNLSLQQAQSRLKLGELLGADGVVFLQFFQKDGKKWLSMQLVAVRPGVIINEAVSPWPLTDALAWTRLASDRQIGLLPKLSVSKDQAVPLSLLNFTSPLLTSETISLDREVTDLLGRRLSQYPDIFVLERRRLNQLADETMLSSGAASFWSGSWMVEGEINPEGNVQGELMLRGKLRGPDGKVIAIDVSGQRRDLSGLIGKLAEKMVAGVNRGNQSAVWDPLDEAAQYYDEARWQFSSGMWNEAQTSAEAAWALGLRMPELAHLRVSAYVAPLPINGMRHSRGYNVIRQARSPDLNLAVTAVKALDSYPDLQRRVGDQDPKVLEAGVKLLTSSLELLEQLHEVKATLPKEIPLALLREQVRQLSADLEGRPGMLTPVSGMCYARTMLMLAPFCEETFEDGLKHYDKLVRKGIYFDLLSTGGGNCFSLAAWDDVNRLEQDLARDRQLEKWRDDKDFKVQISAIMASFYGAGSFYEQEEARERLVECFLRNQPAVIDGRIPLKLWDKVKNVSYPSVSEAAPKQWQMERSRALLARLEGLLAPLLLPAGEVERDRALPGWNELVRVLSQAVKEKRGLTPAEQKSSRPVSWLELRHAETLSPLLIEYRKYAKPETNSLMMLYMQVAAIYKNAGQPVPEGLEITRTAQPAKGAAKKKSDPAISSPKMLAPVQPANAPLTVVKVPPASSKLSMTELNAVALHLPASVPLSADVPDNEQPLDLEILDWVVAKEKLWVEVRKAFTRSWSTRNAMGIHSFDADAVVEVNPKALHLMQVHWLNTNKSKSHGMPLPAGVFPNKRLAVTTTDLFWLDAGRLSRKSLPSGELRLLNVELPSDGRLTVVGDRLFVTASEVVLEIMPKDESSQVLASIRRRPALGPLDQMTNLSQTILIGGPNKSLRAAINGHVYLFNENSRSWKIVHSLPDPRFSKYRKMGDDLLVETLGHPDPSPARVAILASASPIIMPAVRSFGGVSGHWQMPKDIQLWSDEWASLEKLTMSWAGQ
ncbi:MAG: hypothetical protein K0Q55_1821, partial [Verrucomicrobia bacterium]|nr:hypothetical protein [Verrucomicrobiota bacterium]